MKVSEFIKPDTENDTEVYGDNEKNPQRFYYGGYTKSKPPKAFLGLNALFDYFSNRRNKKQYDRDLVDALSEGDDYRDRQIKHVDNQLASSSVGALANFLPTERKEDINLSRQKSDASYNADRFSRRLMGDTEQGRNQALSSANTLMRYAGQQNMGAIGNMLAQGINSANQIGSTNNRTIADMDYRTGMSVSDMDREEQMDSIANKYNYDSLKRQNTIGGIQGLTDEQTAAQSAYASLDPYVIRQMIKDREFRKYMEKKAMSNAANQRYSDSIGDTITSAISVINPFK
jgi:hypothetical protein